MPDPSQSGFIVVEFQKLLNENKKHVCVPRTWIKCKLPEQRVAIAYPEDDSNIAPIINEPADDSWKYYIGDIKFEADTYEDAIYGFMEIKNQTTPKEISKQNEEENITIEPVEPNNPLKLRIVVPKPKLKEKKKKSEKKSLKKHSKEHSKHKHSKSKHKKAQRQSLDENILDSGYTTAMTTSSDFMDSPVASGSGSPLVPIVEDGQVTTESNSPLIPSPNSQNGSSPKSVDSKSDDISRQNHVKQNSDSFERTLESLAAVMENDIDFTKANFSEEDIQLLMDAQKRTNGMFKFIKHVVLDVKKMYIQAHETKRALDYIFSKYKVQTPATVQVDEENDLNEQQNDNSFQEETMHDDEDTGADDENTGADDENTGADDENTGADDENTGTDDEMDNETNADTLISEENPYEDPEDTEMTDESDDEIFSDDERLTETQSTPPPSPDVNNDSIKNGTWTLKHPHKGPGLVPIGGKHSNVYISAKALKTAKQNSINVKIFTRHLFREIFTKKALESCSMTGRKPCFGRNLDIIRPALHSHTRTVIFNYAMKYAREVGWKNIPLSELVQNVRCMLQNYRPHRKYGKIRRSQ